MRILNLKSFRGQQPPNSVYIGRPSKWGNPYTHFQSSSLIRVASRHEAIECYEAWIRQQPALLDALPELVGKDLLCHCKPLSCHGDVLIRLMVERGLLVD